MNLFKFGQKEKLGERPSFGAHVTSQQAFDFTFSTSPLPFGVARRSETLKFMYVYTHELQNPCQRRESDVRSGFGGQRVFFKHPG